MPVTANVASGLKSNRIKQPGELALVIVSDFLDRDRAFALAQQQYLIRPHTHDFIGRRESPGGDVGRDAFGGTGAIVPQPIPRDVLTVSYSSVVSPSVRESMSAVA